MDEGEIIVNTFLESLPPRFDIRVGDELPILDLPPVDRMTLALYSDASNDRNPIHIDTDAARRGGHNDVIAHGMLSMGWLGRLLTSWVDQRQLREFEVRFTGITPLGSRISCRGEVVERFAKDDEELARIALRTVDEQGQTKLVGSAVVSLS